MPLYLDTFKTEMKHNNASFYFYYYFFRTRTGL